MLHSWQNIMIVLGLFVGSAIISSTYPAFIMSNLQPVNILKGKLVLKNRNIDLKKVLIVFQFAASIFLIAGVFAISKQVNYMQNMDIGINAKQLLVARTPVVSSNDLMLRLNELKQEINKTAGIKGMAGSWYVPGKEIRYKSDFKRSSESFDVISFAYLNVNADFIPVTGMNLLCGRMLSETTDKDGESIIMNVTGIKALGYDTPEGALNQMVYHTGNKRTKEIGVRKILGSSVIEIIGLLGKETALLILFSSVIAIPPGKWFIDSWLNNYAYKTEISWYYYLSPVMGISLMAIGTIGFLIYKKAQSNPVDALRYE